MILGVDEQQTPHGTMPNGLERFRFDSQADTYDQRVGFCETDCRLIARAVLSLAGVHPGDVVVEVGARTGQIGRWLACEGLRYVGFDLSQGMPVAFRRRVDPPRGSWALFQADGNRPWPIADAAAQVIFSSRAIHLLALDHVVHEVFRVAKTKQGSPRKGHL